MSQENPSVNTQIAVQTWAFKDKLVRTTKVEDTPYWYACDVCVALGIVNSRQTLSYLDADEKSKIQVLEPDVTNQYASIIPRTYAIVNESGLYSLIFRSRKEEAKVFRRWVTDEVLPAIRKTGSYGIDTAALMAMKEDVEDLRRAQVETGLMLQQVLARQEQSDKAATTLALCVGSLSDTVARLAEGMQSTQRYAYEANQCCIGKYVALNDICRPLNEITELRTLFDPRSKRSIRKWLEIRLRNTLELPQGIALEQLLKTRMSQVRLILKDMRADAEEQADPKKQAARTEPAQQELFPNKPPRSARHSKMN